MFIIPLIPLNHINHFMHCTKKSLSKPKTPRAKDNGNLANISIPYYPALSKPLRQISDRHNISLTFTSNRNLHNMLTKMKTQPPPHTMYGCQIWMPYTMQKHLSALLEAPNKTHLLFSNIAKHPAEKVYQRVKKWVLGRTSNTAGWGDCGAYPLLIKKFEAGFRLLLQGFCRQLWHQTGKGRSPSDRI